jgi:chromate transporter
MSGISAAVVGVIASLAMWFVLHVVFANLDEIHALGASIPLPVWSTIDPASLTLAVAALVAIFRFKLGIIPTLAASAGLGLLYHLIT